MPASLYALLLWPSGTSSGPGYLEAFAVVAAIGVYPTVLFFGIPAYLAIRRRVRLRVGTLMLAGGLVASEPWVLLLALDAVVRAIAGRDGVMTWYGYVVVAGHIGIIFSLGAVGGLVFWLCAVRRDPRFACVRRAGPTAGVTE